MTTMLEAFSSQVLEYHSDADITMNTSSPGPWTQEEASMEIDGSAFRPQVPTIIETIYDSVEVDMETYNEENEVEMSDGSDNIAFDGQELLDVEIDDASRVQSPASISFTITLPSPDPGSDFKISVGQDQKNAIHSNFTEYHPPQASLQFIDTTASEEGPSVHESDNDTRSTVLEANGDDHPDAATIIDLVADSNTSDGHDQKIFSDEPDIQNDISPVTDQNESPELEHENSLLEMSSSEDKSIDLGIKQHETLEDEGVELDDREQGSEGKAGENAQLFGPDIKQDGKQRDYDGLDLQNGEVEENGGIERQVTGDDSGQITYQIFEDAKEHQRDEELEEQAGENARHDAYQEQGDEFAQSVDRSEDRQTVFVAETPAPSSGDPHEISDGVYIDPPPSVLLSLCFDKHLDLYLFNEPSTTSAHLQDEGQSQFVMFQHLPTLYYEPLSSLFDALRRDENFHSSPENAACELILDAPDLELSITEDNIYARDVSLHDLGYLYDGSGLSGPLRLQLKLGKTRWIERYHILQDQVSRMHFGQDQASENLIDNPTTEATYDAESGDRGEQSDSHLITTSKLEPQDVESPSITTESSIANHPVHDTSYTLLDDPSQAIAVTVVGIANAGIAAHGAEESHPELTKISPFVEADVDDFRDLPELPDDDDDELEDGIGDDFNQARQHDASEPEEIHDKVDFNLRSHASETGSVPRGESDVEENRLGRDNKAEVPNLEKTSFLQDSHPKEESESLPQTNSDFATTLFNDDNTLSSARDDGVILKTDNPPEEATTGFSEEFWDEDLDGEGDPDTTWEVENEQVDDEHEQEVASAESSVTLSSKASKRSFHEVGRDDDDNDNDNDVGGGGGRGSSPLSSSSIKRARVG